MADDVRGRDLTQLPVFGPELADCDRCELKSACERGQLALAYRPKDFNGVMFVGEGPGRQEVVEGRPFVGPAGKLLASLCESAGIDLSSSFITNATLGKPPPLEREGSFMKSFPGAVTACLPRLEAEVAAVRPRIIIALGATAWAAISGYDEIEVRQTPFDCPHCDEDRRVGPVLQCSARVPNPADGGATATACGHLHYLTPEPTEDEVEAAKAHGCLKCGAQMKRVRPKRVKCPACGGRKRRPEEHRVFQTDYALSKAAGGIFEPARWLDGKSPPRAAHELHPWLSDHGVEYVIPTYHPAFLLRGEQFLVKTVQKHLQKVPQLLSGARPIEYSWSLTRDPEVVRAFVAAPGHYSVDIETVGRDDPDKPGSRLDAREIYNVGLIDIVGVERDDGEVLVVDTREVDPADPGDPLLAVLYDFMVDERKLKTFQHGGGYDLPVLEILHGIPVAESSRSYTDDTLGSHSNLYPDEPHDLAHMTYESAIARAWKPARTKHGEGVHESFEAKAAYNARDLVHTRLVRDHHGVLGGRALQGGRMDRAGLSEVYRQDSLLRQEAVRMTMRGMPLDHEGWAQAGEVAQGKIDDALGRVRQALDEYGWGEFNPRSTPQKIDLLYRNERGFQLPVIKVTESKSPATDKVTLQKLAGTPGLHPLTVKFLTAMADFLKNEYVAKNFVFSDAMQPWADGRIHPVWKPWGARTGRWTSNPNAMNWPPWLRLLVKAPPGRKIVGADEDQLEMRNIALLSGDEKLIERCQTADATRKLEPDYDPHSYVASLAFRERFTSLELQDPAHRKPEPGRPCVCATCKRKALRELCKRLFYGLAYGAGDATVVESIYAGGYEGPPITVDMAGLVRRTVFNEFEGIPRWRDAQVRRAKQTGELRSPFLGRRRIFPLDEVPTTEIFNFPIQSMGADIMNAQTLLLIERLHAVDPTAFIIAQVHDAVYLETDENRAVAVAELLTETFTVEHTLDGVSMLFTATGSIGDTWKEAA